MDDDDIYCCKACNKFLISRKASLIDRNLGGEYFKQQKMLRDSAESLDTLQMARMMSPAVRVAVTPV